LAVAAGAAIVASAYGLYALLRQWDLTPAGASAIVALVMAFLALLIGVMFLRRASPRQRHDEDDHAHPAAALAGALPQRALQLARSQPWIALGAAVVGAYVVIRRPSLLAMIASSLLGMRAQKKIDRRRRF
jgi:hypothetical protein